MNISKKGKVKNMEKKNNKTVIAVVIVATIIILGLLGAILYMYTHKPETKSVPQGNMVLDTRSTTDEAKRENPLASRSVFFAGIEDAAITKTGQIALDNLPENEDFLLKYEITDTETGELVFETNLIPAGERVLWTPGETMEPGTYKLSFLEKPFYKDEDGNFTPLTSGNNVVTIKIVE